MMEDGPNRKIRLLVVEDNSGDVVLLEEVLRELGARVEMEVASDGDEALKRLFGKAPSVPYPDLILLDLNLPKVNGHQVLLRVKNDARTSSIPVIVMTSSRADSDVKLAYERHANAYLKKPSSLEGLLAAVGNIKSFWMELATLPR